MSVKSAVEWNAVFEGVRGNGPNGNIAIDDIRISKGNCRTPASCDFEGNSMCEYTNSWSNTINWVVLDLSGKSFFSNALGPGLDHSISQYNQGHYAIFNTDVAPRNSTARLESEVVQGGSSPTCFKFFYNMYAYGKRIGQLNVYVRSWPSNGDALVWSLTGNQNTKKDEWSEGRFSVANSGKFQIVFEGVKGDDKANIAIDDLDLFESTFCTVEPGNAANFDPVTTTSIMTTMPVPTYTYSWISSSPFDCNFEDGMCTWSNDPSADGEWERFKAIDNQYNAFNGPAVDHTYGNSSGSYVSAYVTF